MVGPVTLTPAAPDVGELVTASFTIRNDTARRLVIPELSASVRLGDDWSDPPFDFPHVKNIALDPGRTYTYRQARAFATAGDYFVQSAVLLVPGGEWRGIPDSQPLPFTVSPTDIPTGRVQVVSQPGQPALTLVPTIPPDPVSPADPVNVKRGQQVTASFTVRNANPHPVVLQEVSASVRLGDGWDDPAFDFPHVTNVTLAPGQQYTYKRTRAFTAAGAYIARPTIKLNGLWRAIAGTERLNINVIP
jgi:hypothetical protein